MTQTLVQKKIKKKQPLNVGKLTSFSEVPHMLQHLHSMHCQRYVFTAAIITGVNWRQEGWPVGRIMFIT